jgi:hypothetical protein
MLFLDTMHKDPCRKPCHFVVYFSNLLLRGLQAIVVDCCSYATIEVVANENVSCAKWYLLVLCFI